MQFREDIGTNQAYKIEHEPTWQCSSIYVSRIAVSGVRIISVNRGSRLVDSLPMVQWNIIIQEWRHEGRLVSCIVKSVRDKKIGLLSICNTHLD